MGSALADTNRLQDYSDMRLNNQIMTPPGGWSYRVAETKKWFRGYTSIDALRTDLAKHCEVHHLPVPSTELIQEQVCQELGSGASDWCEDGKGFPVMNLVGGCASLSFQSIKQGTATLAHAVLSGRRVESAEAERRARICVECDQNREVTSCKGCTAAALNALVDTVRGGRQTSLDGQLFSCCICSCLLRAKIWLPLDILHAHMPEGQNEQLPTHCWKKKDLNRLRTD